MTMDDELLEYDPSEPFPGKIGRTLDESSPAWPRQKRLGRSAPNIVLFMWDDVGYGQLSSFGGLCPTPTFDRIAERGLRYTNLHATALCTPSRGSLLTGRNHHTLGLSAIGTMSMGFPGHDGFTRFEHGFISEMLLEHGYNTFAIGKWHLTPATEMTAAGPYHRWPLGRGFERFYGFLGGETDQWYPDLVEDNHWVPTPARPEDGYHLNADLADHAIKYISEAHVFAPDKPFFLYYAPGAGHAPHHVEQEWIDRYRGKFDMGWSEYRRQVFKRQRELGIVDDGVAMTESDPDVPDWDSLTDDAKQMYARQMETYAAFLEQTDHHFGRVMRRIEELGELDNTIVIMLSDNGASAEGGVHGTFNEGLFFNHIEETLEDNVKHLHHWGTPDTYPHYAWGWTWAGDTPFRRWKRETYRGGVSAPCIVSWPARIADHGGIRTQYAHLVDIAPTLLDAIGAQAPSTIRGIEQSEIHGRSFAASFDDPNAPEGRVSQYFEMFGSRSMYHDGWKANCPVPGPSFAEAAERGRYFGQPLTAHMLRELDESGWELYNLNVDPTETTNVAQQHPDKLVEMIERWYREAEANNVFPLASAELARFRIQRPTIAERRDRTVWYPGLTPAFYDAAPRIQNRSFSMTARLTVPAEGADGIILTHGSRHGGYAFMLHNGHLKHVLNYVGLERFEITSPDPIPSGEISVRYEFEVTGEPNFRHGKGAPGMSRLYVDDRLVAAAEVPYSVPNRFGSVGFSCGYAAFDSVAPDLFDAPFPFSGVLHEAIVDVSGHLFDNDRDEILNLLAEQ